MNNINKILDNFDEEFPDSRNLFGDDPNNLRRDAIKSFIQSALEESYQQGRDDCYRDNVLKHGAYLLGKQDGAKEVIDEIPKNLAGWMKDKNGKFEDKMSDVKQSLSTKFLKQ